MDPQHLRHLARNVPIFSLLTPGPRPGFCLQTRKRYLVPPIRKRPTGGRYKSSFALASYGRIGRNERGLVAHGVADELAAAEELHHVLVGGVILGRSHGIVRT